MWGEAAMEERGVLLCSELQLVLILKMFSDWLEFYCAERDIYIKSFIYCIIITLLSLLRWNLLYQLALRLSLLKHEEEIAKPNIKSF
jgi:hypothetical protein